MSEQKTQEAERLRAAMDALLHEAGQRTLREVGFHFFYPFGCYLLGCTLFCQVEAVRADYNRNIDKMVEEIQQLEVVRV